MKSSDAKAAKRHLSQEWDNDVESTHVDYVNKIILLQKCLKSFFLKEYIFHQLISKPLPFKLSSL